MRWVYNFAPQRKASKQASLPIAPESLGNKAANLFRMCALGLPVPAGFTLRAELCALFAKQKKLPSELAGQITSALTRLQRDSKCQYGASTKPLLLSVRAGARESMPGMLDTILNLGLNDTITARLAKQTSPHFAYDCYRRLLTSYGAVVLGIAAEEFDDVWENYKLDKGIDDLADISQADWRDIIAQHQQVIRQHTGKPFPQNVRTQLNEAIKAVFASWQNERAVHWRQMHNIPEEWGMAVSVQQMVFGNRDAHSATGVAFTRNPSTGAKKLYGEFLPQAQGEEVVAGLATPYDISASGAELSLQKWMPKVYAELSKIARELEKFFGDVQDIEFTIEQGRLWLLQTRKAKRNINAAFKIAVAMQREGLISKAQAVAQPDASALPQLLQPSLALQEDMPLLTQGLPASPGAVSGRLVFSSQAALAQAAQERRVILVRPETSPEDIQGMHAAVGILTSHGGMTSHAAVVARGLGRPCVCGASALQVDAAKKELRIGDAVLTPRDTLTIDGTSGKVLRGDVPTKQPAVSKDFSTLMQWADRVGGVQVRANADTLSEAETARYFGAQGLGLVRTESSFYASRRVHLFRKLLLSDEEKERAPLRKKLLALMRSDFVSLFQYMGAQPIAIRLLDPPLQDFLPHKGRDIANLAKKLGLSETQLRRKAARLAARNPLLGHRGARVALTAPDIFQLQLTAIFEAVAFCARNGQRVVPELMIPFVNDPAELAQLSAQAQEIAAPYRAKYKGFRYLLGVMIETPRSALLAGGLARYADFMSFGSNDLTQMVLGMSRDDTTPYLQRYLKDRLLPSDPFVQLDEAGVGDLMRLAVERARAVKPKIILAICGDHGGEPQAIALCAQMGLDYVSCAPYRVPVARLASAQTQLAQSAKI